MNALGTSITMISRHSYESIVSVKNILQWFRGTWSIFPWKPPSSWFSIQHYSYFDFFCCAILIQYQYIPLSSSILRWNQLFNRNRLKCFSAYKVGPYPWFTHHYLLVQNVVFLMQKIPLWKAWYFSIVLFLKSSITLEINLTVLSDYSMRLIFSIVYVNKLWFISIFIFGISSSNVNFFSFLNLQILFLVIPLWF